VTVVLHCAEELRRELGGPTAEGRPESTPPWGQWHAALIHAAYERTIVLMGDTVPLTIALPARTLQNSRERIREAIRRAFVRIGPMPSAPPDWPVVIAGLCHPEEQTGSERDPLWGIYMSADERGPRFHGRIRDLEAQLGRYPELSEMDALFVDHPPVRRSPPALVDVCVDLGGAGPPAWLVLRLPADLQLRGVHDVLELVLGLPASRGHDFGATNTGCGTIGTGDVDVYEHEYTLWGFFEPPSAGVVYDRNPEGGGLVSLLATLDG